MAKRRTGPYYWRMSARPRLVEMSIRDWLKVAAVVLLALAAVVICVVAVGKTGTAGSDAAAGKTSARASASADSGAFETAVFLGDSYVTGKGSSNGGFAALMAKKQGWKKVSVAVDGAGYVQTAAQPTYLAQQQCAKDHCNSLPEQIKAAVADNPDVIVVSAGSADVDESGSTLAGAIPAFFVNLKTAFPDAKIYVVSPLWDNTTPPAALGTIAKLVRTSAVAVGATYIDVGQPLRGHPSWVVSGTTLANNNGAVAIADAIDRQM